MAPINWGNECLDYSNLSHIYSVCTAALLCSSIHKCARSDCSACTTRTCLLIESRTKWMSRGIVWLPHQDLGRMAAETWILNHSHPSTGKGTDTMHSHPHTFRRLSIYAKNARRLKCPVRVSEEGIGTGAIAGQLVFIKDKWIHSCGLIPITFDHLIN